MQDLFQQTFIYYYTFMINYLFNCKKESKVIEYINYKETKKPLEYNINNDIVWGTFIQS